MKLDDYIEVSLSLSLELASDQCHGMSSEFRAYLGLWRPNFCWPSLTKGTSVPWRENVSLHLRLAETRQDFRVEISWCELSWSFFNPCKASLYRSQPPDP